MDYWKECISEAFDDAGITATDEQIGIVASWAQGARENYGMAHGHDCIPNPVREENEKLKRQLEKERQKKTCPVCDGKGRITTQGPHHSGNSGCWGCGGEGRVDP
ncbi:MAG: hypothetical protein Q8L15_10780 [Methylobacter sp.]|nr:hypothetical protein [Methylobacter sp.]